MANQEVKKEAVQEVETEAGQGMETEAGQEAEKEAGQRLKTDVGQGEEKEAGKRVGTMPGQREEMKAGPEVLLEDGAEGKETVRPEKSVHQNRDIRINEAGHNSRGNHLSGSVPRDEEADLTERAEENNFHQLHEVEGGITSHCEGVEDEKRSTPGVERPEDSDGQMAVRSRTPLDKGCHGKLASSEEGELGDEKAVKKKEADGIEPPAVAANASPSGPPAAASTAANTSPAGIEQQGGQGSRFQVERSLEIPLGGGGGGQEDRVGGGPPPTDDVPRANGGVAPTLITKTTASSKKRLPIEDFDDMLHHVGSWGRFQIMLTVFFFPFNLFLGYVYLSSILTNFTPPHWCQIPELVNLTQEARRSLAIPFTTDEHGAVEYSKCQAYSPDWVQVLEKGLTSPDPSWPLVDCMEGWEFDTENYHRSIVSDFSWVCGEAWVPSLSQAMFFAGAIPGTLLFGWISDNYGRMPVTLATNVIAMVTGLATPFVSGYQSFIVCRFLMGLSFNTFFTQPYILTLEYVDESKRTFVGNIGLALFLTVSGVYQPWLIKALGDWRVFNWILFGQFVTIVAVPFIMPESGRWLLSKGKIVRAERILRRIAKINKEEVSEEVFESFRSLARKQQEFQDQNGGAQTSFLDLFRTPNLRKITLMVILLWMFTSLIFDASVRNVENLNFSIYISFMISTGLELPADLLSIPGLNYLGRRWSAALSLALTGIFMLATIPFLGVNSVWGVGVMSMMSRFWATYAMNTGFQFTVEVMPTQLRSQGNAIANVMSMVSQIASPYVVGSHELDPVAPFVIIGISGLIAAIPGLFLPETAGVNLPDTIQDAEDFGRHDRFFWMPLAKNSERYKRSKKQKEADQLENPVYILKPTV